VTVLFYDKYLEQQWNEAKRADPLVAAELNRIEQDPGFHVSVTYPPDVDSRNTAAAGGGAFSQRTDPDAAGDQARIVIDPPTVASYEERQGRDVDIPAVLAHEAGHLGGEQYRGVRDDAESERLGQEMENMVRAGHGGAPRDEEAVSSTPPNFDYSPNYTGGAPPDGVGVPPPPPPQPPDQGQSATLDQLQSLMPEPSQPPDQGQSATPDQLQSLPPETPAPPDQGQSVAPDQLQSLMPEPSQPPDQGQSATPDQLQSLPPEPPQPPDQGQSMAPDQGQSLPPEPPQPPEPPDQGQPVGADQLQSLPPEPPEDLQPDQLQSLDDDDGGLESAGYRD
jgi:hypothetical protein